MRSAQPSTPASPRWTAAPSGSPTRCSARPCSRRADGATLQRAHAALARTATSDEVRARHLAGATEGRDPNVAAALEAAAAHDPRPRGDARCGGPVRASRGAHAGDGLGRRAAPRAARRRVPLHRRLGLRPGRPDPRDGDRGRAARSGARRGAQPARPHPLLPRPDPRCGPARRAGREEAGDDPRSSGRRVIGRAGVPRHAARPRTRQRHGRRGARPARARVGDGRTSTRTSWPTSCCSTPARSSASSAAFPPTRPSEGSALISEHGRSWEHDGADGIAYGLARQLDDARPRDRDDRAADRGQGRPGGDDPVQLRVALGPPGAPRRPGRSRGVRRGRGRGLRPRGCGRLPVLATPGHRPGRRVSRPARRGGTPRDRGPRALARRAAIWPSRSTTATSSASSPCREAKPPTHSPS